MRRVICALLGLAFAPSAFAGDLDIWRTLQPVGPGTFYNWTGFYLGGFVGWGDASGDFSAATQPILAYTLRNTTLQGEFNPAGWLVLGNGNDFETFFGGFAGYNTQWQDLVLGVEANYNHTQFTITAPATGIGRITPADSDGNSWTVVFTGSGSAADLDYGTLRFRGGLDLGRFMPYGFAGFALGQADITLSTTGYAEANAPAFGACSSFSTPPCYFLSLDKTTQQTALLYGFSVGGGVDVALLQNFFLRGEVEYVRFAPISNVVLSTVSGRVGAGIKF